MKSVIAIFFVGGLLSAMGFAANHFWFGKTLSPTQAEARWGKGEFITDRFKSGKPDERAKMAVSLVKEKKLWIGKEVKEVRQKLGSHDGYYFTDWIPAYLIQVGKSQKEETWQIVFLPDNDYKVKDIIIHRNCCD